MLSRLSTAIACGIALVTCPSFAQQEFIGANDFRISQAGADANTAIAAESAAIAYNSIDDEFIVVWSADDTTDEEFEIYAQRFDASEGTLLGAKFRVSDMGSSDGDTDFDAMRPAVAYNSTANEYLIVWEGDDDSGSLSDGEFEIFGQRVDARTGVLVGTSDFRISDMGANDGDTAFDAGQADVAYNSQNDEYLVVWEGDDDSGSLVDGEVEIFGQRLSGTNASPIGGNDFRISDMGATDGSGTFDAFAPAVAYNSINNEYLVVWQGDDDTGALVNGEFEIFGQRINAENGSELGSNDFRISDMGATDGNSSFDAVGPSIAYNSTDNEYLIAWEGDDDSDSLVNGEFEIFIQRICASSGAELGTNDQRISDMGSTDGDFSYSAVKPKVAYNSRDNEFVIVWQGDDDSGSLVDGENEVFAQRVNAADGATVGSNDIRVSDMGASDGSTAFNALEPTLAYDPKHNRFLILWSGDDDSAALVNDEFEIFGQLFGSVSDLAISKTANEEPAISGSILNYRVSLNNNGPDIDRTTVRIVDTLPANTSFISASGSGWTCSENMGVIECDRASAALGPSPSIDLSVRLDQSLSSPMSNTATVSSDTFDLSSTNDSATAISTVVASADLSASLSESAEPLVGGNSLTYTASFTNAGPSHATSLTAEITLPSESSGIQNITANGWSCSTSTSTISCTRTSLSANTSSSIITTLAIPKDLSSIIQVASSISSNTSDPEPDNNFASESTQILSGLDHDGDGIPDGLDPDDDGDDLSDDEENTIGSDPLDADTDDDGLTDGQEVNLATNPLNPDTDNDNSDDGTEVSNGSDPLDSGSKLFTLGTKTQIEWNAHLPPMLSVLESVGLSNATVSLDITLHDFLGMELSQFSTILSFEQQVDLLIHEAEGYMTNSYGNIQINQNGVDGDLDGRIVQYKLDANTMEGRAIEFAVAVPFEAGERGKQYVPFNTFQPSLRSEDAENLVTNWIQLSNLDQSEQGGSLIVWSQSGELICQRRLVLQGNTRIDLPVHTAISENADCSTLGPNRVGIVEWRPDRSSTSFLMRNARYYYDNDGRSDSLLSASILTATKGTRRILVTPYDRTKATAVIEVSNTSDSFQEIEFKVYNSSGDKLADQPIALAAKASTHIILDDFSEGDIGHVTVKSEIVNGVQAYLLQYGRTAEDPPGLTFAYAAPLSEPLSNLSRASFSSYLNQDCHVLLSNPSSSDTSFDYSIIGNDGVLLSNSTELISAGTSRVIACNPEEGQSYGTFRLESREPLSAMLLRSGENNDYRIQIPLR
jgi:uncharacterized repeat protein (TIGR01451 family)